MKFSLKHSHVKIGVLMQCEKNAEILLNGIINKHRTDLELYLAEFV